MKLGWWLLGFLALAVLGLWLAHARAKARVDSYHNQLAATGERLSLAAHLSPPPASAKNGAPEFLKRIELLPRADNTDAGLHRPWPMQGILPSKAMVSWKQAQLPREQSWLSRGSTNRYVANVWPEFSVHLAKHREALRELAATVDDDAFFLPFDAAKFVAESELPWFMGLSRGQEWLDSALLHDLRFDATGEAWRWWRADTRLVFAARNPRAVIGLMIHNKLVSRCASATWEALQFPGWSDAQLAEIQRLWQSHDAVQTIVDSFSMERAFMVESFARYRTNLPALWTSAQMSRGGFAGAIAGPPDGWQTALRDDPIATLRDTLPLLPWPYWTSYIEEFDALRRQAGMINAWQLARTGDAFQLALALARTVPSSPEHSHWRLFSDDSFEVWSLKKMTTHARVVTQTRIVIAALALHRHRLKHGTFPSDLNALVPALLPAVPRDFMDGKPLRYRLEPDGQFRLWSVGEDFTDDSGDATPPTPPKADESFFWLKGRDWVWPQPATEAEITSYHAKLAANRLASPESP